LLLLILLLLLLQVLSINSANGLLSLSNQMVLNDVESTWSRLVSARIASTSVEFSSWTIRRDAQLPTKDNRDFVSGTDISTNAQTAVDLQTSKLSQPYVISSVTARHRHATIAFQWLLISLLKQLVKDNGRLLLMCQWLTTAWRQELLGNCSILCMHNIPYRPQSVLVNYKI